MYGCGYQEVGVVGRRRVWLAGGMYGWYGCGYPGGGCGWQEVGVASGWNVWVWLSGGGCGWNLLVWLVGVFFI